MPIGTGCSHCHYQERRNNRETWAKLSGFGEGLTSGRGQAVGAHLGRRHREVTATRTKPSVHLMACVSKQLSQVQELTPGPQPAMSSQHGSLWFHHLPPLRTPSTQSGHHPVSRKALSHCAMQLAVSREGRLMMASTPSLPLSPGSRGPGAPTWVAKPIGPRLSRCSWLGTPDLDLPPPPWLCQSMSPEPSCRTYFSSSGAWCAATRA